METEFVGDLKCYYCGHVSGQLVGALREPLRVRTFKPRPGYQGQMPHPGDPVRCERCRGPVYLEDVRPVPTLRIGRGTQRVRRSRRSWRLAGA